MAKVPKITRRAARPRPDMYSKKRTGYVSQTVRFTVDEAKLIREASTLKGQSISYWIVNHTLAIAKKEIAAAAKTTE